jgi:hypothetical protein
MKLPSKDEIHPQAKNTVKKVTFEMYTNQFITGVLSMKNNKIKNGNIANITDHAIANPFLASGSPLLMKIGIKIGIIINDF